MYKRQLLGPTTLVTLSSLWTFQVQHSPVVLSYPLFAEIGYALFTLLMYAVVIFLLFKCIPYRYVPASNALLGALITAIIIMIYKRAFVFYASATLTLSTLTALVPTVALLLYLFSHTLIFENYANQLMNYAASLLDLSLIHI